MYLKNLTLRGFKSFASSTTLRFEPGITAVVGPNGSGKSNVVDALAWVMGEQGAKSLRGGKMEDVIFAGTASRAPLGRAEVVLTIDNSDGALPIDYSEVTISRLMFRSGSSEYAINGDACRLLDIQELLSDSGIGREMHVIIGQGQLDRVLHSGPEGRRAVIEEAAGVLKHRKRKEKALRKLDAMQGNLTRVQDLTGELRRQLKPLGRQAEIARRAAVIQADLRDARLRLLADDLVTLRTRLEQEAADEAAVRARRAETERALAGAQEREAVLEAEEAEQAPRLARVQDTWFQLSALKERLRGVADLAAERHRNAAEDLEAAALEERRRGRDPEDMEREAAEIREQEEMLRAALEEAQDGLAAAVGARADAEEALAAEEHRLRAAARAAADRREELARMRGRVEALRSRAQAGQAEIGRLDAARDEAARRAETAQREFEAFEAEVVADPALAADHEAAQEALATAKDAAEQARAAVDGPRRALAQARTAVGAARSADQAAQKRVTALQARIEALNLTLASAADGGEALLSAAAGGSLDGVLGTVASLLTVRPGYETAVAAALGDAAEGIAVGSLGTAETALALLRDRDAGRAGLLVGGGPADPPGRAAGVDYAIDAVTVPEPVRSALAHLLRDVAVVDDVPAAVALVRREPSLRAVTRDGELVGAHWAQGGAGGGQGPLQMRGTLDQATEDLAAAETAAEGSADDLTVAMESEQSAQAALDGAQAAVNQAQSGVNQAQGELDRVRARLREHEAQAAQEVKRAARLEADVRAARGEAERLAKALDAAHESLERDTAAAEELAGRLAESEEAAEVADEAGHDTEARDELSARCQELRSAEMEARLSVRTAEERVQAITGRADALERGARREREERARAVQRRLRRERQAA
uniref:chromosome segregation protein SMC n=1 Tax=Actinomadura roseirufa TaxID=2094049 RepID=UPI0010414B16